MSSGLRNIGGEVAASYKKFRTKESGYSYKPNLAYAAALLENNTPLGTNIPQEIAKTKLTNEYIDVDEAILLAGRLETPAKGLYNGALNNSPLIKQEGGLKDYRGCSNSNLKSTTDNPLDRFAAECQRQFDSWLNDQGAGTDLTPEQQRHVGTLLNDRMQAKILELAETYEIDVDIEDYVVKVEDHRQISWSNPQEAVKLRGSESTASPPDPPQEGKEAWEQLYEFFSKYNIEQHKDNGLKNEPAYFQLLNKIADVRNEEGERKFLIPAEDYEGNLESALTLKATTWHKKSFFKGGGEFSKEHTFVATPEFIQACNYGLSQDRSQYGVLQTLGESVLQDIATQTQQQMNHKLGI